MRVFLINAPLASAVCAVGVGHQMPLGLLMIGGPLLDAGYDVALPRQPGSIQLLRIS
jgi:anaerobic magnesium-protoporphyrin IX monomethyl ester cyclase